MFTFKLYNFSTSNYILITLTVPLLTIPILRLFIFKILLYIGANESFIIYLHMFYFLFPLKQQAGKGIVLAFLYKLVTFPLSKKVIVNIIFFFDKAIKSAHASLGFASIFFMSFLVSLLFLFFGF